MVTAVRFSNGQEAFPLTTAAQNMHAFLRKSPLCRSHFFEWLKTAISSTACGRVTLKSLLPQGAYAPHVHPRLRKRLARCTLDCGFKTSESPALRGFVAERAPIRGTSLYLVLKSNGLPRPKIRLKKFGFSSKSVPANIAKKLPSQRCFKPLFIASFNFSHKRRNVRFKGLRRVHTPPQPRTAHTTAHRAKHGGKRGAAPCGAARLYGIALVRRSYTCFSSSVFSIQSSRFCVSSSVLAML